MEEKIWLIDSACNILACYLNFKRFRKCLLIFVLLIYVYSFLFYWYTDILKQYINVLVLKGKEKNVKISSCLLALLLTVTASFDLLENKHLWHRLDKVTANTDLKYIWCCFSDIRSVAEDFFFSEHRSECTKMSGFLSVEMEISFRDIVKESNISSFNLSQGV